MTLSSFLSSLSVLHEDNNDGDNNNENASFTTALTAAPLMIVCDNAKSHGMTKASCNATVTSASISTLTSSSSARKAKLLRARRDKAKSKTSKTRRSIPLPIPTLPPLDRWDPCPTSPDKDVPMTTVVSANTSIANTSIENKRQMGLCKLPKLPQRSFSNDGMTISLFSKNGSETLKIQTDVKTLNNDDDDDVPFTTPLSKTCLYNSPTNRDLLLLKKEKSPSLPPTKLSNNSMLSNCPLPRRIYLKKKKTKTKIKRHQNDQDPFLNGKMNDLHINMEDEKKEEEKKDDEHLVPHEDDRHHKEEDQSVASSHGSSTTVDQILDSALKQLEF